MNCGLFWAIHGGGGRSETHSNATSLLTFRKVIVDETGNMLEVLSIGHRIVMRPIWKSLPYFSTRPT